MRHARHLRRGLACEHILYVEDSFGRCLGRGVRLVSQALFEVTMDGALERHRTRAKSALEPSPKSEYRPLETFFPGVPEKEMPLRLVSNSVEEF